MYTISFKENMQLFTITTRSCLLMIDKLYLFLTMSKYVRISIMYHNDHFSLDDTSIFYVRVLQSEYVDLTCEFQLQYVIWNPRIGNTQIEKHN